jgi:hypothetical protein
MTAVENVALPLTFCGMNREKRTRMAVQMLKAVHLGSRLMHRPTQMSGGQQQRVGIARAFIAHPKIVFADEPTGNLDTKTSREVMELMVAMAKKYGETLRMTRILQNTRTGFSQYATAGCFQTNQIIQFMGIRRSKRYEKAKPGSRIFACSSNCGIFRAVRGCFGQGEFQPAGPARGTERGCVFPCEYCRREPF